MSCRIPHRNHFYLRGEYFGCCYRRAVWKAPPYGVGVRHRNRGWTRHRLPGLLPSERCAALGDVAWERSYEALLAATAGRGRIRGLVREAQYIEYICPTVTQQTAVLEFSRGGGSTGGVGSLPGSTVGAGKLLGAFARNRWAPAVCPVGELFAARGVISQSYRLPCRR